ncbi:uncharacterized protein PFL1_04337 [Pseudozyma flocculosa PF-1]|nr:uncharacterized protein PFL1_04337 [Pseudozyma flocculosa PF-1]EPQ28010.1 hypothetical protein PFL1_04337 [Pseudozyma flocculosa PF-1]
MGASDDQGFSKIREAPIGPTGKIVGHLQLFQKGQGAFVSADFDGDIKAGGLDRNPSWQLVDNSNPSNPVVVFRNSAGPGPSHVKHSCAGENPVAKCCEWLAGIGPSVDYVVRVGTSTGINSYHVDREFTFPPPTNGRRHERV